MGLRGLGYSALGSIEREIETPESRSKYLDRNERLWCCWTHESTMARWLREASVVIAKAIVLMLLSSAVCMAPAMAQSTPVISPTNGSFATEQTVTITTSSGSCYYTLDGSVPTTSSIPYTGSFSVNSPTQVNAVSYLSPNYSSVSTAYLDVDPALAPVLQTGLILRLRAGLGVVASGSPTYVSLWNDLSGQGNNASGTSGSQPTFVYSGANFLQAVKFNGSSQFLSFPSLSTTSFTGLTMFVVLQPSAITASARIVDFGDGASGNDILFQIASSGSNCQFWTYSGTSGTYAQSASALNAGQAVLLDAVQSGNSATFNVNGTPGTTNSSMNSIPFVTLSSNVLGQASNGGNYYPGQISEVLLYSTALTSSQITAIEAYLIQKYQLSSIAPAAPIVSVSSGTLSGPTQVVISSQPGTTTYITTDGTTPTTSSQIYSGGPLTISFSQTLKAISVKSGVASSGASATYTLDSGLWPAPSSSDPATPAINLQLPAPGI